MWASLKHVTATTDPQIPPYHATLLASHRPPLPSTILQLNNHSWSSLFIALFLVYKKPVPIWFLRKCIRKKNPLLKWREGLAALSTCEVTQDILKELSIALRLMPKPAETSIWKKCHPASSTAMMLLNRAQIQATLFTAFRTVSEQWGSRKASTSNRRNDRRDLLFLKLLKRAEKYL